LRANVFSYLSGHLVLIMKLLYTCLLGLAFQLSWAQNSTISSGGVTKSVDGRYYSHVIGQSSVVTGTTVKSGITIRQGFKQPNLITRTIKKSGLKIQTAVENPISYTVFPNPFQDKLRIQFSEKSTSKSYVVIYDIVGSVMWEETYPEGIIEINLTDFKNFRPAKYVLHLVQTTGKPFVASIVKE
jgi:hypothetical protein